MQAACIPQGQCSLRFKGPFKGYTIDEADGQQQLSFESFEEAAIHCENTYECKGVVLSKLDGSSYKFYTRNTDVAYGYQSEDEMNNSFDKGYTVAWVRDYDTECCHPTCIDCFRY